MNEKRVAEIVKEVKRLRRELRKLDSLLEGVTFFNADADELKMWHRRNTVDRQLCDYLDEYKKLVS